MSHVLAPFVTKIDKYKHWLWAYRKQIHGILKMYVSLSITEDIDLFANADIFMHCLHLDIDKESVVTYTDARPNSPWPHENK